MHWCWKISCISTFKNFNCWMNQLSFKQYSPRDKLKSENQSSCWAIERTGCLTFVCFPPRLLSSPLHRSRPLTSYMMLIKAPWPTSPPEWKNSSLHLSLNQWKEKRKKKKTTQVTRSVWAKLRGVTKENLIVREEVEQVLSKTDRVWTNASKL